jgi:hypothetical protein
MGRVAINLYFINTQEHSSEIVRSRTLNGCEAIIKMYFRM